MPWFEEADRGHGHLAQAQPPELSIPGRIDATNAGTTRNTTNKPNQASRRAEAIGIIWGELEYQGPKEDHEVHIRRGTPKGST